MKLSAFCIACLVLGFGVSCSSAPKRPLAVFNTRNMAETQLDLANRAADQGKTAEAMTLLAEALRLARSVDDPSLLSRVGILQGNILMSEAQHDEAFRFWEEARAEAETAGNGNLAAQARLHALRGRLSLISSGNPGKAGMSAEEISAQAAREMGGIKNDDLSLALGWIVTGLAEKQRGRWTEAENALRRALDIHEKNRHLEEAAYDWFLIASVRSVAGRYDAALEALKTAVEIDRRGENGFALANDWAALGEVNEKAGREAEASAARKRAAAIYRAIGKEEAASELEGNRDIPRKE
jgi:tetratricopeptide (TPR) repeat protein